MRLLVIVSADYGELGVARYFLDGLGLLPAPVMLVPAALRQPEMTDAGVRTRTYATFADIQRAVEEVRPDIVLLFSGYLLTIGKRFSLLNSLMLFRLLRSRGVRIITSDPFIGLLRGPGSLRFREMLRLRASGGPGLREAIVAPLLALRTYLVYRQLRRDWHIYPAPTVHRLPSPAQPPLSFFNGDASVSPAPPPADGDAPPLWLFVLSRVDFGYQLNLHGEPFVAHVAARLRDAARPGRRVLMIGPKELLATLRWHLPEAQGIELRAGASYDEYMRELMRAECAFFWNYYSFSVLHRVLANRPVFFFDEGHMVSILPAMGQTGIDTFYAGWRPPLIALDRPLDESGLERLAVQTRENFARIKARMQASPSPRQVLAAVAADPARVSE